MVGFLIYDFCSYYSLQIILFTSNVWQVGWILAKRNSRAVLGREHFPTLSIIYSNYNQCFAVLFRSNMGTANVHERGTLKGDEMYPRGGEEGDLECKSAKAIRLLREYCHSNAQQHYATSQDRTVNCTDKYFVQSNRLLLTCLPNSKMIYLASASPIFDLKIYFYKQT